MKNFTIALLGIAMLFAACKEKNTTATKDGEASLIKYSATDFTKKNLAKYNSVQYYLMLETLYANVADSTISAFNDEGLKEKLSPIDFDKMHSTMQMVQAANPEFPNDPFDLIDTLILTHIKLWELEGLSIDREKNLFAFEVSDSAKTYFKWDDVKGIFNAEQLALVDLFLADGKGLISYKSLKDFGERTFSKIAKQLFNWGTEEGDIEVYETYKLEKTYTKQEAKEKSMISEVFRVTNPDNLDDVTDIIDSIIYTPLNPDSIEKLRIYFVWSSDKNLNTVVKTHAFAPKYRPMASGYKLPLTPLFLLKANAVQEKQSDIEKAYITYFSLALTRNKGTYKTSYKKEAFQGSEYWE